MPELAEVEFYRKQWNPGVGEKILKVHLHSTKRIFRGIDTQILAGMLTEATLLASETHGKQMLFHFSGDAWLGVHLGMSGKLRVESASFLPEKHDHLVLRQKRQSLVFSDPRQFGRILFHAGKAAPEWWQRLPPQIGSAEFTFKHFEIFLQRHSKSPIKAVLLMQSGFPGVGNWMADEILWQAKVLPQHRTASLAGSRRKVLFDKTVFVCAEALGTVGSNFSDPPASWLFRHRWKQKGVCPRCRTELERDEVAGRTTCWCPKCQK